MHGHLWYKQQRPHTAALPVLGGTLYLLCMVSVLSQSKKNYELRCKEADEAEKGAEKTTSKNPDKVQQVNELPHYKNMSDLLVVWRGSDTNVQGIIFRPSSLRLTTPPNDHRFSSVHELQVSS